MVYDTHVKISKTFLISYIRIKDRLFAIRVLCMHRSRYTCLFQQDGQPFSDSLLWKHAAMFDQIGSIIHKFMDYTIYRLFLDNCQLGINYGIFRIVTFRWNRDDATHHTCISFILENTRAPTQPRISIREGGHEILKHGMTWWYLWKRQHLSLWLIY